MSLLVWLPMTKDLTQQGLSNVTVTNNGAIVDNNGKLGKCYYFDGNDHIRISLPSELTTIKNTTICAWIKSTGSTIALGGISNDTNYANAMATLYTSGWQFSGSGAYKYLSSGLTVNNGTWHHVVCTIDDTTITTYKDGAKVTSNTLSNLGVAVTDITSANFIEIGCDHPGGDEYLTGYVNDFRIYDHALSPKEVEILSRGLVCHYPLNGGGRGGDNLLKNSNFLQGTNGMEGYTATGATCTKQSDCMKVVSTGASNGFFTSNFNSITTGVMTTFSAYVKADSTMTIYIGTDGSGNGSCQSYTIGTNWQRISISKEKTTNNANLRIYGQGTFYAKLLKYELGSIITPWIPNSADTAYTAMGYNSTTEYDVSGNGYNGTKNNITYDSNTARYSVCSKFDGSSTRIAFSDIYIGNEWSYGLWIKAPQSTTRSWENIVMLNETGSDSDTQLSFWINLKSNICQSSANKQYNSGIAYPNDGNWHHFFATFDGSNLKTYIDGLLVNTKAITNTWFQRTHLTIGAIRTGDNTYNFYSLCNLSDFRLYATALSATQVAELYNTAVSVANNGTLMGYELVEV